MLDSIAINSTIEVIVFQLFVELINKNNLIDSVIIVK